MGNGAGRRLHLVVAPVQGLQGRARGAEGVDAPTTLPRETETAQQVVTPQRRERRGRSAARGPALPPRQARWCGDQGSTGEDLGHARLGFARTCRDPVMTARRSVSSGAVAVREAAPAMAPANRCPARGTRTTPRHRFLPSWSAAPCRGAAAANSTAGQGQAARGGRRGERRGCGFLALCSPHAAALGPGSLPSCTAESFSVRSGSVPARSLRTQHKRFVICPSACQRWLHQM